MPPPAKRPLPLSNVEEEEELLLRMARIKESRSDPDTSVPTAVSAVSAAAMDFDTLPADAAPILSPVAAAEPTMDGLTADVPSIPSTPVPYSIAPIPSSAVPPTGASIVSNLSEDISSTLWPSATTQYT